ncbi:hypothetical protein H5P28_10560 [Ruficoccus amylovorans]|uniref:Uncharacterized protein n=1 Tax=Ruficoccus amylovorans TaxID=1804625 RepID=A0A842HE40_9BACT|nr:hypothetical protein [Ruficoccus amylovorans]MBC2594702.1 hypothetical protein [Ruficoccus amylovorans]
MRKFALFITFLSLSSYLLAEENPLIGYFSNGDDNVNIRIDRTPLGKYELYLKQSKDGDWEKACDLRYPRREELKVLFGDTAIRVGHALVLQDQAIPNIGFFYIKPGQFGTTYLPDPIYLMYLQKGNRTIEIKKAKKE